MKILIVGPTFYPDVNGASYFTQRLASYLHARGNSVLVIAPSRYMRNELYDLRGVAVFGIRSFPTFINKFRVAQLVFIKKVLRRKIKRFAPDVIHLQSHLVFGKAVVEIAEELGIPVVGTNHFMPENLLHYLHMPEKIELGIKRFLWGGFSGVFDRVDAVTTPTKTGAKLLADVGFGKKVTALSCGIDLKIYTPKNDGNYLKKKYNLPDKPTLLYLGRLDKEKNVEVLLRAFALALKKVDIHFVIAGFGVEEPNLRELVASLEIEDAVTFTGFVTDKDKPYLYRVADCFAIAGIAELQSIVTMEAMASGLPVIAVDAMALPHLVRHGKNGYLFKLKEVKTISKYIISLLSDPKLRKQMSKKSLELIKEHGIEKMMDRYEAIYKDVIDKKKTQRD